ncbi:hypothetical protein ACH4GK_28730 [Streptomyces rimosus]|uniref:hypothetical protein n=1 Tax=Streptomyces rimosus TaxID=1927 RepID=UPI0004C5C387|nr:hypothetical protein [Streptomyces rimosus]
MGRPKSGETPKHNVRVPDPRWDAAKKRAKTDGTTITSVIVSALRQYAEQGTIPLSDALTSRLLAQADARAKTQRHLPPLPDDVMALMREKAMDTPAGPAFPRQVQMRTYIADDNKVLFDSAEVTRLLRALGKKYRISEAEQVADQLDIAALTALDER